MTLIHIFLTSSRNTVVSRRHSPVWRHLPKSLPAKRSSAMSNFLIDALIIGGFFAFPSNSISFTSRYLLFISLLLITLAFISVDLMCLSHTQVLSLKRCLIKNLSQPWFLCIDKFTSLCYNGLQHTNIKATLLLWTVTLFPHWRKQHDIAVMTVMSQVNGAVTDKSSAIHLPYSVVMTQTLFEAAVASVASDLHPYWIRTIFSVCGMCLLWMSVPLLAMPLWCSASHTHHSANLQVNETSVIIE